LRPVFPRELQVQPAWTVRSGHRDNRREFFNGGLSVAMNRI
jgi:hypothetical protein